MAGGSKAGKKPMSGNTTPIAADCQGQILSGKIEELRDTAKQAVAAGDDTKAAHFYTMAIDAVAKGMPRDKDGNAKDSDLEKFNKSSEGALAELLCGRSHVYIRQRDWDAAIEDARTCVKADPTFEKGHLRLIIAYEQAGASVVTQLDACERGLENCPHSEVLVTRKWRLKKAVAEQATAVAPTGDSDASQSWGIEQTRRVADNETDPRRGVAAADLGRAFASGAHGLKKDLEAAVKYLSISADAGDVSAQRDLGIILLEMEKPVEGAEQLRQAAEAGDDEAAAVLQQVVEEANERQKEARVKLEKMAQMGDPRAASMLRELADLGA